jgi:hypothetical protein
MTEAAFGANPKGERLYTLIRIWSTSLDISPLWMVMADCERLRTG